MAEDDYKPGGGEASLRKTLRGLFPDRYPEKPVTVVTGAPGSGKTTYVRNNKGSNDLIVDMDYLCAALNANENIHQEHEAVLGIALQIQEMLLQTIESRSGKWDRAFVVTANPDRAKVHGLAKRLGAKVVEIDTTREQCIENIRKDNSRRGREDLYIGLVNNWFDGRK